MKSMSGRDFVNSLSEVGKKSEDSFVVGMAKAAEGDKDAIMVGPTHKCGPWTKIPLSAISRVVPLMTCPCRSHEHPVVAIYFRDKDDPVAAALGQLLASMQKELFSQLAQTTGRGSQPPGAIRMADINEGPGSGGPGQQGDCFIFWVPVCWERDFSHDDPMPAGRPGDWLCILVPIVICWPA